MIVVVGSLNLDLVVRMERMPEPGETVLASGYAEHAGGKGANQAVAAARSGGRVAMVGRVGDDAAGRGLRAGLEADDVDVAEVRTVDAPTGRALIEVDDAGENRIVVVPGANARWTATDLPRGLLSRADVVLLQREVPDDVVAAAVALVADSGGRSVLNLSPAGRPGDAVLQALSVLLVNESEAISLASDGRERGEPASPREAARALAARIGGEVVVTLGARGVVHAGPDGEGHVQAFAVEAVDTTGAGDAFAGALATAMDEGAALPDGLRFACAAGALAVTRQGAQPSLPHRREIDAVVGGG